MVLRGVVLFGVLIACVGWANQPGSWLYVRLHPQAVSLLQTGTLWLGDSTAIERILLRPEQTIAVQMHTGAAPVVTSAQRAAIERAEEPLRRTIVVRYTGALPPDKFCALLMATHPFVEYAEPVRRQRLFVIPNDPLFAQQQYLQVIEAPAAWNVTIGSPDVLIGVSDSGVRFSHEDLSGALALNSAEIPNNGIDDDGNGYIDDYRGYNITWRNDQTAPDNVFHPTNGHGTSVAGIIAATQNNGKGISGIAPGCRIVPIKATPNSSDGYILFGYESLIYAAVRGCKVVNCSWGNEDQTPSPIEESIIAYAIARDVAIVAASGNGTGTQPMYPAAYPGVLGVGETELDGSLVGGTGIGAHCRILAPGSNARTTGNLTDNDYTYFSGTSSAAPMVSGVVALVRSRYPQLTALQAIEHVRLSAQNVSAANPDVAQLLPGMVNARRALERDPFSTPAIVPLNVVMKYRDGTDATRTDVGDTLLVYFQVVNRLGNGSQLQWELQVLQAWGGQAYAVEVLDRRFYRDAVSAGEEFVVGPFSLVITSRAPSLHFLRLSVQGRGSSGASYADVALLPWYPTPDWTTIRRDGLSLSVGDYGWYGRNRGSGQEYKGDGLSAAHLGSLLYGGGIFAVHFPTEQVRDGIRGDALRYDNDFVPVELSSTENQMVRVLRDTSRQQSLPIGIQLREQVEILDSATVYIRGECTNVSAEPLYDVAVGYFLDFDLTPTGDSSVVSLLFESGTACAEIIERMPGDPIIVALVRSGEHGVRLQCAGLDAAYASVGNFLPERMMESLRRGTSLQMGGLGDKSMVVGVRILDTLQPMESRRYEVFILLGRSRVALRQRAESFASVEQEENQRLQVVPNPVNGTQAIVLCNQCDGLPSVWRIIGLDGQEKQRLLFPITPRRVNIPLQPMPPGVYVLDVQLPQERLWRLFIFLP